MKTKKKTMTEDQFAELEAAENAFLANRENVIDMKADLRDARIDLERQKKEFAKSVKVLVNAKKRFDKTKAKYKGWAKPGGLSVVSDRAVVE